MAAASRLTGFRRALGQIGLPAWFLVIDLLWLAKPEVLAIDARHYQRAASAWLAGGDPWAVVEGGAGNYAAGPHTLLFYAPTSPLPLEISATIWMVLGLVASVWLVRRLRLPVWWILFPPLAHAVWNGNPQTIALALLVHGAPWAAVVAVGLKLYTALTLVTRPRVLVLAGIVLFLSLAILPWHLYLDDGLGVGGHLDSAWNGSAWRFPILVAPALLALWVLRHKGAEWFAVPAVWPATQFYYVGMALPAIVHRPILAALLALPVPLMAPLVVMGLAVQELRRDPAVIRPAFATPRLWWRARRSSP